MLSRIVSRQFTIITKNRYAFGGSHGPSDYSVNVNKEAPWVQYKSVNLALSRMKNWSASKECMMSTILFNHLWKTIPSNISKISLSFLGTDLSIINHGITKILINLTSRFLKEVMSMDKILLNQGPSTQDQSTWRLWFLVLSWECMLWLTPTCKIWNLISTSTLWPEIMCSIFWNPRIRSWMNWKLVKMNFLRQQQNEKWCFHT